MRPRLTRKSASLVLAGAVALGAGAIAVAALGGDEPRRAGPAGEAKPKSRGGERAGDAAIGDLPVPEYRPTGVEPLGTARPGGKGERRRAGARRTRSGRRARARGREREADRPGRRARDRRRASRRRSRARRRERRRDARSERRQGTPRNRGRAPEEDCLLGDLERDARERGIDPCELSRSIRLLPLP